MIGAILTQVADSGKFASSVYDYNPRE